VIFINKLKDCGEKLCRQKNSLQRTDYATGASRVLNGTVSSKYIDALVYFIDKQKSAARLNFYENCKTNATSSHGSWQN
jgi:hypothetical protein